MILLIITSSILCNCTISYSQIKNKFIDSLLLKKEIDSVLAKHGLKSKGFAINVISINQNGGQTAYSITNNFYGDPGYVPDSINYTFHVERMNGHNYLFVSPKHGTWSQTFFLYDSTKGYPSSSDVTYYGMTTPINGMSLNIDNTKVFMSGILWDKVISPNIPLYIYLDNDPNGYFAFGDFSYNTRFYIFHQGKVFAIPYIVPKKN